MMLNIRVAGSKGPFNPPSFSHMYKLTADKEDNDKGKWFGWKNRTSRTCSRQKLI